jgi:hypothetical protein
VDQIGHIEMNMAIGLVIIDTQDLLAVRIFTLSTLLGSPYFLDRKLLILEVQITSKDHYTLLSAGVNLNVKTLCPFLPLRRF